MNERLRVRLSNLTRDIYVYFSVTKPRNYRVEYHLCADTGVRCITRDRSEPGNKPVGQNSF